MWNVRDLPPPPNFTYRCITVDVATLKKTCLRAVAVLQDQKQLHSEAALLSRFLYSMKTKFRSDKGFNILGKVNRKLLEYLSMNLHATYMNFCECVPDPSDPDQYIPSRQMLQHVLVRTQSFACLWCYIASHCQEAARLLRARMGLGHNWWAAVVALAITSRIWAFGKYFIVSACEWFSQLKPFLEVLKLNGPVWLPDNYTFPDDLHLWLGTKLHEKDITSEKGIVKPKKTTISLDKLFAAACGNNIEDDGDDITVIESDSVVEEIKDSDQLLEKQNVLTEIMDMTTQTKVIRPFTEDVGESVTREIVEMLPVNNNMKSSSENGICVPSAHAGQWKAKCIEKNYTEIELPNAKELSKNRNVDLKLHHKKFAPEVPERNKKQKNVFKKKLPSLADSAASLTERKQITQLKTHFDLISFIEKEEHLREHCRKSCVTHNLDLLQWNMLKNLISSYVKKLKKKPWSKDEEKYKLLLKKARKEIKARLI